MALTSLPPAWPRLRAATAACWEMLLAPEVLWLWIAAAALTKSFGAARYPSRHPAEIILFVMLEGALCKDFHCQQRVYTTGNVALSFVIPHMTSLYWLKLQILQVTYNFLAMDFLRRPGLGEPLLSLGLTCHGKGLGEAIDCESSVPHSRQCRKAFVLRRGVDDMLVYLI